MKKEQFKEFVRKNPKLISYVKNNEMTWQKFYEMYELYGENNNIWDTYLKEEEKSSTVVNTSVSGLSLSQVVNWFKNVDLDSLQEGIGNVQRVLGVVQDFSKKDNVTSPKETYKPRPLYKHFED
ncbi:MAG: spore coat protein YlbD [bacterium]|nr:spore coat protein YlbD [bacterium]